MGNIRYKLKFFSPWHCGSGQAAGADVDAVVVRDRKGMPYVPGKTIKGLLREASEILHSDKIKEIDILFGAEADNNIAHNGCLYFSNATLQQHEYDIIANSDLKDELFLSLVSTAIDDNGIAKDKSLRKTEVVVPCELEGEITYIPDDKVYVSLLTDALRYVKRMGTGRNRGLGRCQFIINEK